MCDMSIVFMIVNVYPGVEIDKSVPAKASTTRSIHSAFPFVSFSVLSDQQSNLQKP